MLETNPNPIPNQKIDTKEELVNNVKEWIKVDNEITKLKTEIKEKNNKKKLLSGNLLNVMKTNDIDCFDINGGAIVYKKTKVKKPITGKILLKTLEQYFKNDIPTAQELTKHILDNREEQIKELIKRKIDK
jgi:hypothetical protein